LNVARLALDFYNPSMPRFAVSLFRPAPALALLLVGLAVPVAGSTPLAAAPETAGASGSLSQPQSLQESPPPPLLPPARQPSPLVGQPLRPEPGGLPPAPARRFDQSLDELVREGIVTPAERQRIRTGVTATPVGAPAHQRACSSGALSAQECRTGVVVRWRGRGESPSTPEVLTESGSLAAGAMLGEPLTTPITVPVSALLAGPDGTFALTSVFGVTPRPAPVIGNGNRRLLFPLIGSAITSSNFGYRLHPVLGSWLLHAGKDLAAPEGTPVVAALAGRVVSSGLAGGYGLAVEIEHDRPRRRTLYGHLSELYVKPGDRVRQGEVVGRVGSTGLSTGPHLHFELRLPDGGGWVAVDPGDLDPGRSALGSDAVAMLMGQLLQRLERPPASG
jgi:hypothetical protein